MADMPIIDLTADDNELSGLSPAELHHRGLGCLAEADGLDSKRDPGARSALAITATSFFFASLSADNLQASARQAERPAPAHRASSGEHPVNEFTGHHA